MIAPGTPQGVPDLIDCAVREFAYNYGKSLLPDRGDFKTLFDAMQLQFCNLTAPTTSDKYVPPKLPTPTNALFVCAQKGSDDADGTRATPYRTITRALGEVGKSKMPAAIVVRGGVYELDEPLQIGPQHSGLRLQNFEGEEVTLAPAPFFRSMFRCSVPRFR
jgi:hypothetical protein